MNISGIQKLTLLDYPGKVACTVFISGCNFRCPYCHNSSLVLSKNIETDNLIRETDLLSFLDSRKGILDGVVITGGEPLLNRDLPQLIEKIKSLGYKIKLDTNGSNPGLLKEIVSEGLVDKIAMDIKSSPDGYSKAAGLNHLDFTSIDDSKNFIMSLDSRYVEYEFRTTVVKGIHRVKDISELAKWLKGAENYYLQQFKNSKDLINPTGLEAYDEREMNVFAEAVRPYVPKVQLRGI